jgi:hypothetical protein
MVTQAAELSADGANEMDPYRDDKRDNEQHSSSSSRQWIGPLDADAVNTALLNQQQQQQQQQQQPQPQPQIQITPAGSPHRKRQRIGDPLLWASRCARSRPPSSPSLS